MLELHALAPDFTLPNQNGGAVTLSSFRGKKVVLYFYPKDMTSGCTSQAVAFEGLLQEFKGENAVILGVSKDSVASHKRFAEKYGLEFDLLSDPEGKVLEAYGAWAEKSMYGRKFMGIVRTTYILDENGVVLSAEAKVKAKENPTCVLSFLKKK